jgi:hypothetical protein
MAVERIVTGPPDDEVATASRSLLPGSEPGLVDVPGPSEAMNALVHSAAAAVGWELAESTADTVSPVVDKGAVRTVRTGLTWIKLGRSLAEGDGPEITASIQEKYGFSIDLSARVGARRGVSPLGEGVGWSPTIPGPRPSLDLAAEPGVAPDPTVSPLSGHLEVSWFDPSMQPDAPTSSSRRPWSRETAGTAVRTGPAGLSTSRPQQPWPPATVEVRAGLIDAVHLPGRRKLRPRTPIACLALVAPAPQVLDGADVFGPDTVVAYAQWLGVAEAHVPTARWYLHKGRHGALANSPPCRLTTVAYLDPDRRFGAVIELPVGRPPLLSHLAVPGTAP